MSNLVNDNLIERAQELAEEFTSHPSRVDERLLTALKENDLQEVRKIVSELEAFKAEEAFHAFDIYVY